MEVYGDGNDTLVHSDGRPYPKFYVDLGSGIVNVRDGVEGTPWSLPVDHAVDSGFVTSDDLDRIKRSVKACCAAGACATACPNGCRNGVPKDPPTDKAFK